MDRLESMSVLLAVVEAGSLSAAARRLGMPLATVSRRLSDLERHLKARLVNRSSRRLSLTDAGRSYVAACRRILEDVAEAERAAAGEYRAPKGALTVSAPIVFGRLHVLPVVAAFLESHGEIDIRLVLTDRVVDLLDEHVDVAVRAGALPDSSLMARRVGEIRLVTCASPAYAARRRIPASPAELGGHDCITFDGLMLPGAWTFRSGDEDVSVAVHSRLTVTTAEAAIDAAVSGLGLTRVLSYQVASAVRDGTLVLALEDFEPPSWPISLVYAGQPLLPLKLRAFLDFAAPRLTARLSSRSPQDAAAAAPRR